MPHVRPLASPDRDQRQPLQNDYKVVWKSDFGERRVGRIRLAESSAQRRWEYHLYADIPVPPWGSGRADSLKDAQAAFRKVFEKFCDDAGNLSKAFQTTP